MSEKAGIREKHVSFPVNLNKKESALKAPKKAEDENLMFTANFEKMFPSSYAMSEFKY